MPARPQGARLDAICKATGWPPHSARAAPGGLRKAGSTNGRRPAGDGKGGRPGLPDHHGAPDCRMMRLDDLRTMDRAALPAAWPETFGSPAPKGISRAFLRRFPAFGLRARRSGGLPGRVAAALMRPAGQRQAEDVPAGPQAGRTSAA